jgi:hypothetical protein
MHGSFGDKTPSPSTTTSGPSVTNTLHPYNIAIPAVSLVAVIYNGNIVALH